jgi:hypothetical protein
VNDVQRLFRCLVRTLASATPERLHDAFRIAELHEQILPYRRFRRELRLEAIEDYEMAILRLLAGEGGLASVEPEEVRDLLAHEARAINPSPGVFRGYGEATVRLDAAAVEHLLREEEAWAPPDSTRPHRAGAAEAAGEAAPLAEPPALATEPPDAADATAISMPERAVLSPEDEAAISSPILGLTLPRCPSCQETLPIWRTVAFCPFCGERIPYRGCGRCGERLEPGWRHCVTCGEPVID